MTKFDDFCSLTKEGLSFGVEEGVDMWLPRDAIHFDPRFRLTIIVGNDEKESTFLLNDGVSMLVAMDTCDVLMSLMSFKQSTVRLLLLLSVRFCVLLL